ncbi:MAG TPA: nitrile hydratase subunit beta [Candidatus Nitrosotalea sp.]|jgi:nitrile hydratase|nr:nitrile hydratase subunit beta [Candidatus Nitrosotalea sp.]
MDGVHDLGGMQGFGPVEREENEPVFHADWEAAVLTMMRAGGSRGLFNIDEFRHGIERMAPAHYLRATYYEKWLDGVTRLLIEKGVVGVEELAARRAFFEQRPDAPARAALSGPPPAREAPNPNWAQDVIRKTGATPRFAPGDAVLTREIHPHGHTRLPRYARGRRGVVHRCHGIHVFPDTNAHGQGEQPQPLYSVRFDARELWGESAELNQAVHIDLWESYLLPGR